MVRSAILVIVVFSLYGLLVFASRHAAPITIIEPDIATRCADFKYADGRQPTQLCIPD